MYRVTITTPDGRTVLELTHPTEQGALLVFGSARTYPGDTVTLTHEGAEVARRHLPEPDIFPDTAQQRFMRLAKRKRNPSL